MKDEYEKQLANMRLGAVKALDTNNEQNMELKMEIRQITASLHATEKELTDTQAAHREQTKELQTMMQKMDESMANCKTLEQRLSEECQHISELNTMIKNKDTDIDNLGEEMQRILVQ